MTLDVEQSLSELVEQVSTITIITEPEPGRIDVRNKLSALWERVGKHFSPKVESLVTEANSIRIKDQQSYDEAASCLKAIKGARKDIDLFRAVPDRLHALWKDNLSNWNGIDSPLVAAEQSLKGRIIEFDRAKQREEDAKRAKLEADAREKAQKEADERARAAKKAGASNTEVAEIRKAPEYMPPPEPKPNLQRATGQSISENWQAEVRRDSKGNLIEAEFARLLAYIVTGKEDRPIAHPELLCILEVNEPNLRKLAKAQRSSLKLPAVKVYDKGSLRASSF